MHSSRNRETSHGEPGCSIRGVRGQGVMVWALMVVGLLTGSMPGAAQAARQHEAQLVQGQRPHQPPAGPVLSRPVQAGQATVTVDGGMLSVSLREVGLREVMAAIARQAGLQVSFLGAVGQTTLTASFVGLPLEDGLRRLLRGLDYAFVYTGTGAARRVGQVFVMSGAADQPQAVAVETGGEPSAAVTAALREAIDTQRFAEMLKAAIAAAGGTTQADESGQAGVARELNAAFQRVLSGQDGAQLLRDQSRQVTDRLRQLLEQSGP